jgi:hypothetical protein
MKCVDCIHSFYTSKDAYDNSVGMQFRCSKFQVLLLPIGSMDAQTFIKETNKQECVKEESNGRDFPRETQVIMS